MTAEGDIRYEVDGNVAVLTWDQAGKTMNVIDTGAMTLFSRQFEKAIADPAVHGIVVTSGKKSFIAGADLNWVEGLANAGLGAKSAEQKRAVFDAGFGLQMVLRRVETAGKPVAAAVPGIAMGGGLEICLACHRRFVADDPKAMLGLPESKVGLLPGGGGTQRLTRMLGATAALPLLLEGTALSPRDALKRGIIDEVVAPAELLARAKAWASQAPAEAAVKPWDKPGFVPPGPDPRTPAGLGAMSAAHALQRSRTFGNYPALDAIQCAVYDGLLVPMDRALRIETRYFIGLLLEPTARNMIRTNFINVQKANRLAGRPAGVPKRALRKVGVLGAGMMGAGIAHVSAQAGLEVVLIDRDQPSAERGLAHIRAQQERLLKSGRTSEKARDLVLSRILCTTEYAALADVDLVVEAVFEDRDIKADVTRRAEAVLPAQAVFASNTSTLPITGLAQASSRPDRFIGLHFFSPVERMPLVEVIRGKATGDEALALALDYVQAIKKTPVVVNDGRGFYTSRVFATYTGEDARMPLEGVPPALVENAGRATGMPMPPLALLDEVSIELAHHVQEQTRRDLGAAYKASPVDALFKRMVELGRVGKKAGKGFYDYESDGSRRLWSGLADIAKAVAEPPPMGELRTRLLDVQALETARCMQEGILQTPADADVGALLGWGFAPWTGGPLSYIDTTGPSRFVERCETSAKRWGERFVPPESLRRMATRGELYYPPATAT